MKTLPSIETQKKMHAFFMKTSAPRIYRKFLDREDQTQEFDDWLTEWRERLRKEVTKHEWK